MKTFLDWLLAYALPLQFTLVPTFGLSLILLRYHRVLALIVAWTTALVLAAGNITLLATTPRPARPAIVITILVTWAIAPPLFFIIEWNLMRKDFDGVATTGAFEQFKYSQELGSRFWGGMIVILALLAQVALGK